MLHRGGRVADGVLHHIQQESARQSRERERAVVLNLNGVVNIILLGLLLGEPRHAQVLSPHPLKRVWVGPAEKVAALNKRPHHQIILQQVHPVCLKNIKF